MSLKDDLREVPTWAWWVGGGVAVVLIVLGRLRGSSPAAPSPDPSTATLSPGGSAVDYSTAGDLNRLEGQLSENFPGFQWGSNPPNPPQVGPTPGQPLPTPGAPWWHGLYSGWLTMNTGPDQYAVPYINSGQGVYYYDKYKNTWDFWASPPASFTAPGANPAPPPATPVAYPTPPVALTPSVAHVTTAMAGVHPGVPHS